MVARGDVWWVEVPDADRRPYLILTRSEAVGVLTKLLAVPCTRTIREIPTEVPLGRSDGMPAPCVLSLDNVTVIRKSLCTKRITRLSPATMREVCDALRIAAAC